MLSPEHLLSLELMTCPFCNGDLKVYNKILTCYSCNKKWNDDEVEYLIGYYNSNPSGYTAMYHYNKDNK